MGVPGAGVPGVWALTGMRGCVARGGHRQGCMEHRQATAALVQTETGKRLGLRPGLGLKVGVRDD